MVITSIPTIVVKHQFGHVSGLRMEAFPISSQFSLVNVNNNNSNNVMKKKIGVDNCILLRCNLRNLYPSNCDMLFPFLLLGWSLLSVFRVNPSNIKNASLSLFYIYVLTNFLPNAQYYHAKELI